VYKFLTPNYALSFFEQVIVSQVVVIGVVGGLNIGVLNEGRKRMESRDQVMVLYGSSLHSNHSKLSDITAGKLSVKSQFQQSHGLWMASIVHSWFSQGQEKAATKSKPVILQGNTECSRSESVLDQQSIFGKITVWFCVCGSQVMWNPVTYSVQIMEVEVHVDIYRPKVDINTWSAVFICYFRKIWSVSN